MIPAPFRKQTSSHPDEAAGLHCPECGAKAFNTMQGGNSVYFGGTYWRRKKCMACGHLVQTYEIIVETKK